MSLLFADSMDHYSDSQVLRKYDEQGGITLTASIGRNSTAGFRSPGQSANNKLRKAFASAPATIIAGFATFYASLPSGAERLLCSFYENATLHVDIRAQTDGRLAATRNGTLLGTSTLGLGAGQYNYIEVKTTINDSTGVVAVKVNNVSFLN